jgi:hypothetical protein
MTPEIIIGIVIASIIGLSFLSKLFPKSKPKEKQFKCAGCNIFSPHTERTIEAWRNKKTRFFCPACHRKWLQSRSPQEGQRFSAHPSSSRSGCLGVVVMFALVPIGYFLVQVYA